MTWTGSWFLIGIGLSLATHAAERDTRPARTLVRSSDVLLPHNQVLNRPLLDCVSALYGEATDAGPKGKADEHGESLHAADYEVITLGAGGGYVIAPVTANRQLGILVYADGQLHFYRSDACRGDAKQAPDFTRRYQLLAFRSVRYPFVQIACHRELGQWRTAWVRADQGREEQVDIDGYRALGPAPSAGADEIRVIESLITAYAQDSREQCARFANDRGVILSSLPGKTATFLKTSCGPFDPKQFPEVASAWQGAIDFCESKQRARTAPPAAATPAATRAE